MRHLALLALFSGLLCPLGVSAAFSPAAWKLLGAAAAPLPYLAVTKYTLKPGDTLGNLAKDHGLTPQTLLSYNQIKSPRFLRAGQSILLPSRDGLCVDLAAATSVRRLADTYQVYPDLILLANGLPFGTEQVSGRLFVPGAQADPAELRKLLGTMFAWPTTGGRISSYYGMRNDPFTGVRTRHSGVDIAVPYGTPVFAAADGTVVYTGYDAILGNHIVIDQGDGYQSVYGHLSAIKTKAGRKVRCGARIGLVGSTGYSTGPHLHFSAYRWGRLLNPMTVFS